jgi:hypothetical protein
MVGKNVQAIGLKLDFEDDSFILNFSIIIFCAHILHTNYVLDLFLKYIYFFG